MTYNSAQQDAPKNERFLTTRQVAELLKVSQRWLDYHRNVKGDGPPHLYIGRLVRYPESELYMWLEQLRVNNE